MTMKTMEDHIRQGIELFEDERFDEAFEIFKICAKGKEPFAQYMLGLCYYHGHGTDINKASALFWFLESAEQSLTKSQMMVGYMYLNGDGVEQDTDKALSFLEKAAEKQDVYSCRVLGGIYSGEYSQIFFGLDITKAIEYFEKGVALEDPACMQRLAYLLSNDNAMGEVNFERSLKLNIQAAQLGNTDAAYNAGLAYAHGKGADVNKQQALYWYKIAAVAGVVLAQHNLAALYFNSGEQADTIEAHYWYLKAAEKGSYLSQNCLGLMYQAGQGVEKNPVKALSWFILASRDGKHLESAELAKSICSRLTEAEINQAEEIAESLRSRVNQSPQFSAETVKAGLIAGLEAYEEGYYARALSQLFYPAQQGNAWACRTLGMIYRYGLDVQKNYPLALRWFDKASRQGDAISQLQIGEMYQQGLGIESDPEMAYKYFKFVADCSHPKAQFYVGLKLQTGDGVEKDLEESIKWFESASKLGNVDAQLALAEIYIWHSPNSLDTFHSAV